ncbi:MAG TPA: transposase [Bryobacteraceae bacterium]|nr:transposase [Bryobacteraceae bacterium]
MDRLQGYRFELAPDGQQERKMRQFAGSARYVFNRALAIQNQERESTGRKQSGYAALCRMLTEWRNDPETAWLGEAPVHATQQALRNLEAAWSRHFESLKKLGLGWIRPEEVIEAPKFKKKHPCRDSFRYPDRKQFQIEQGNIEDRKVRNMSRSAAGTKENPGSNVKHKSGLNRSILDPAWGAWSRQLRASR